ncbi:MAG: hypothetical protein IT290_10345 [Deltaproteobacteria bacterium]|nr:hypothetical protein [Deltaproteobacteria bacterium]
MKGTARFRALGMKERALVAVGVLLDGHDAADFLVSDKERHLALTRAARDLAELPPDLRMPLLGSLLRRTLDELE